MIMQIKGGGWQHGHHVILGVVCGDHQHHDNLHGGDDQFNVKVVGHSEQHKERVYLKIWK